MSFVLLVISDAVENLSNSALEKPNHFTEYIFTKSASDTGTDT